MSPKVSVVIPSYNRADYLIEAVESVLSQTCQDFEIIVVDDGSSDDTDTRLAAFIKRTPSAQGRVFYHKQKNSGSAIARNRGLFHSKGEYVAFLDSDDLWYPEKLEKQVKILDDNHDIDLVYTDCYCGKSKDDPNQIGFFANANPPSGYIFERIIKNNLFWTSSLLVRKEVFIRSGTFDPTLRRCQDYDLWIRISHCAICRFIPEILGLFREHSSRITKNHLLEEHVCRAFVMQAVRWQDEPNAVKRFKTAAACRYAGSSRKYRNAGDFKSAIRCLKKARSLGFEPVKSTAMLFLLRFTPFIFRWHDSRKNRDD